MGWVLRLVETGIDGAAWVIDVMDLKPTGSLGDIGNLGLTLPEAKLLLGHVQQVVVAVQADEHAVLRPDCPSCGGACHVKDWRLHRVATLFGTVAVQLPRFRCGGFAPQKLLPQKLLIRFPSSVLRRSGLSRMWGMSAKPI